MLALKNWRCLWALNFEERLELTRVFTVESGTDRFDASEVSDICLKEETAVSSKKNSGI